MTHALNGHDGFREGELGDAVNGAFNKAFRLQAAFPEVTRDGQFDLSPDGKRIVTVCSEDTPKSKRESKLKYLSEAAVDMDGYDWATLCWYDIEKLKERSREKMVEHFGYDPEERDRERWEMARRGIKLPKLPKAKGPKKPKDSWTSWGSWVRESVPEHYNEIVTTFVDEAGAPIRRVTYPSWSPDGNSIAFVRYNDSTMNLWVADVASGVAKPIGARRPPYQHGAPPISDCRTSTRAASYGSSPPASAGGTRPILSLIHI